MKEEENIKTKIAEEFKKKLKLELLQKKSRNYLSLNPKDNEQNNLNTLRTSKYPIDKNTYDKLVKSTEDNKSPEHTIDNQRKSSDNLKDTTLILPNENNIIPIMQPLTTKYFLDAYKKVTLEDLKEKKKRLKKDQWIEYQYMHFGTYVSILYNILAGI